MAEMDSRVSQKIRIIVVVVVGVLLVLSVRTVLAFSRYRKVERLFPSVQSGESRISVITKMGAPNYHADKCGVIQASDKNCALEFVYSHPFAPLVPEYYVVSFSSDDRVIEADELDSP